MSMPATRTYRARTPPGALRGDPRADHRGGARAAGRGELPRVDRRGGGRTSGRVARDALPALRLAARPGRCDLRHVRREPGAASSCGDRRARRPRARARTDDRDLSIRFWSTEDAVLRELYGVVAIDPAAGRARRAPAGGPPFGSCERLARHLKRSGRLREGTSEREALDAADGSHELRDVLRAAPRRARRAPDRRAAAAQRALAAARLRRRGWLSPAPHTRPPGCRGAPGALRACRTCAA